MSQHRLELGGMDCFGTYRINDIWQKKWIFLCFNLKYSSFRSRGGQKNKNIITNFLRKADTLLFADYSYFPSNIPGWEKTTLGHHITYRSCSCRKVHFLCNLVLCGNIWIYNLAYSLNLPINNGLRSYHFWFLN